MLIHPNFRTVLFLRDVGSPAEVDQFCLWKMLVFRCLNFLGFAAFDLLAYPFNRPVLCHLVVVVVVVTRRLFDE